MNKKQLTKEEVLDTIKRCKRSSKLYLVCFFLNLGAAGFMTYINQAKYAIMFCIIAGVYAVLIQFTDWLLPKLEELAKTAPSQKKDKV
jgi:hypothetical protein